MWKNPNGCKNMTGILQNTNAERFFLTRYRLEFQPISALKKTLCQLVTHLSADKTNVDM